MTRLFSTQSLFVQIRQELGPGRLLPSLFAGIVTGINSVTVAIAYATLIFSGALSDYVLLGIGLALVSSIVLGALTAVTSSFPSLVAGVQGVTATLLALIAAAIARDMPPSATSQSTFYTVVAALSAASLLTGGAFVLLGQFKLGNLVRYIPYPVVGGFLAGTSILFIRGGLSTLIAPVPLARLSVLARPDVLARWLPGLAFAALLLGVSRRYKHFLVMPGALAVAIAAFYMCVWLTGTSVAAAMADGWLLSAQSLNAAGASGALWQPWDLAKLGLVHWVSVAGQAGNLAAVVVVSAITLLLRVTGAELVTGQDADVNRELEAAGLSNLVAGLGGGIIGFHSLADTALAHKMGAGRMAGIFAALVCGAVLTAGGALLAFFPRPVLGGLLLFLGFDLMVEWVYKTLFRFPTPDYAVLLLIMIAINTVGFMEGVGLGVVLAVVLFVVNYSRLSVVKHTFSGDAYASHVERPRLSRQLLRQKGRWLYILELQGFIFFGTSHRLFEHIRQRINDATAPTLRFVALDFRLVSGLDSSAALAFIKLKQLAQAKNIVLVFTHLSRQMQRQLRQVLEPAEAGAPVCRVFADLDHGVEWCEDQILATLESIGFGASSQTLLRQLENTLPASVNPADLAKYLERREIEPGYYLIRQGDEPRGLYFIEAGQVTAQLECDGAVVRLRTMGTGTVVGELGLYLGQRASASVLADQPGVVYWLSAGNLERMEREAPELASAFHRFIATLLSERLASATNTLQALLR